MIFLRGCRVFLLATGSLEFAFKTRLRQNHFWLVNGILLPKTRSFSDYLALQPVLVHNLFSWGPCSATWHNSIDSPTSRRSEENFYVIHYKSTICKVHLFYLGMCDRILQSYLLCFMLAWCISHITYNALSRVLKIHDGVLDLSLIRSLTNVFKIVTCSETITTGTTLEMIICFIFLIISTQAYHYEPRHTYQS